MGKGRARLHNSALHNRSKLLNREVAHGNTGPDRLGSWGQGMTISKEQKAKTLDESGLIFGK